MFKKTCSLLILISLLIMIGDEAKAEEKKNTSSSTKNQIKFHPHPGGEEDWRKEKQVKIEVSMKNGEINRIAVFERKGPDPGFGDYSLTFKNHPITLTFSIGMEGFLKVGAVLLKGNDHEDVFFQTAGGGSGSSYRSLNLFCPKYLEVMQLGMEFPHNEQAYPIPGVFRSENFTNKNLSNEKKFLEIIKFEEGYMDESDLDLKDPHYAVYIWKKNNGNIEDGELSIKKYKNPVTDEYDEIIKKLKIGDRIYFAREHLGIDVHDTKTGEYYILYYKDYKWFYPTVLKNKGPYLIAGTDGQGLFIINTETFHLRHHTSFYKKNRAPDHVERVDILPSKIVVNGKVEIDLPEF
ncbi:MAG: hypothetical protein NPINA01_20000 [Nitrospinaceae bacterium]|nr:MAG: hypothetical protein NPINA01_20000 [Nitrospinaceae bacterium]